jgi:nucleotide-binding universal stress UspA family protein
MPPFSHILVPVDFSERCLRMMPYVKAIAEHDKARISLLHVVNPIYAIPETGVSVPALVPVPQWVFKEKLNQLEQFALSELRDLPVRRLVYEGDPEAQIAAFTRTEDVDLVVMPTHGYGVLRRYLIGSITAKVLDDVPGPVLTGAQAEAPASLANGKVSHIVCAVDLGPHSADTLAWASRLAEDFGAKLSLVHVIPPISPGLYVTFTSRLKQEWEEMARKDVEKLQKEAGVEGVSICIQEGDVPRALCSFAHSIGADLLVIGRGAHLGGGGRLRTNAYAIIRQADCAVLSV